MSEGHGDPPADVRSFLPRPGEPVEQYAERLRALHRDLTLVLQAVERGLAAAAHPEDVGPPLPSAHEPIDIAPEPADESAPAMVAPPAPRSGMPRVEVMPAPSGEQRRQDEDERRGAAPRWSKGEEPAQADGRAPGAPGSGERPVTRAARFPSRPSVASDAARREPEWVDRDEGFTAPTFPSAAPERLAVPPLLLTAFAAAWLVVVALLVALLVS